jgi:hypothetical protein
MYVRAHKNGVETKKGCLWKQVKFCENRGYLRCCIKLDGKVENIVEHRLVYYAHNQDWDIWDSSQDNMIDHINRIKTDNRIENLRVSNNQKNQWNQDAKGYYCSGNNSWRAYITPPDGVQIKLGTFKTEEDAHNAYLEAKNTYHIID